MSDTLILTDGLSVRPVRLGDAGGASRDVDADRGGEAVERADARRRRGDDRRRADGALLGDIFAKFGFRREGLTRESYFVAEAWHADYLYALLASEWRAQRAAW